MRIILIVLIKKIPFGSQEYC